MLRNLTLPKLRANMTIDEIEEAAQLFQQEYRNVIEDGLLNFEIDWQSYQTLFIFAAALVEGSKSLADLKLWQKIFTKAAHYNLSKGFIYSNTLAAYWGALLEAYEEVLQKRREQLIRCPEDAEGRRAYGELTQYQQKLINPDAKQFAEHLAGIRSAITSELAKAELTWGEYQVLLGSVQKLHARTHTLADLKLWYEVFKKAVVFDFSKKLVYTALLKENWEVLLDAHSTMLHTQRKWVIEFPLIKTYRANFTVIQQYGKGLVYPKVVPPEIKEQEVKQPEVTPKKDSSGLLSWFSKKINVSAPKAGLPAIQVQRLQQ